MLIYNIPFTEPEAEGGGGGARLPASAGENVIRGEAPRLYSKMSVVKKNIHFIEFA